MKTIFFKKKIWIWTQVLSFDRFWSKFGPRVYGDSKYWLGLVSNCARRAVALPTLLHRHMLDNRTSYHEFPHWVRASVGSVRYTLLGIPRQELRQTNTVFQHEHTSIQMNRRSWRWTSRWIVCDTRCHKWWNRTASHTNGIAFWQNSHKNDG